MNKPVSTEHTDKSAIIEVATKAANSADFLVDDLKQALKLANGVEGIVVLGLIAEAQSIKRRIEQFHQALSPESSQPT
jgi:hypothetical protein